MALLWVDGFPYTDFSLYYSYNSTRSCSIQAGGRFNARYLTLHQYDGCWARRAFLRSDGAQVVTLCSQWAQYMNTSWYFYVEDAGTEQWHVQEDPVGYLSLYLAGTKVQQGTKQLSRNTWQQMEVKTLIDPTSGTVLIKVDGDTHIDYTGQTRRSANSQTNVVRWGTTSYQGLNCYISDVILMDTLGSYCNDLLGSRRVQIVLPTADGNYKNSTPSSGSDRYAMIDEIPPATADYNTLAAAGDTDTFVVEDLGATQGNVNAVIPWIYGKTSDAGAAKIKAVARHNSTDGYSSVISGVPGSSGFLPQMPIYINPSTSQPFTRTEFNAAEFGYKRDS